MWKLNVRFAKGTELFTYWNPVSILRKVPLPEIVAIVPQQWCSAKHTSIISVLAQKGSGINFGCLFVFAGIARNAASCEPRSALWKARRADLNIYISLM